LATKKTSADHILSIDQTEPRSSNPQKWLTFIRSPLARKIVFFNLIALGMLMIGMLYLNQSQDVQVKFRGGTLAQQAQMITVAIKHYTPDEAETDGFNQFMNELAINTGSIVQLYENSGELKFSFVPKVTGDYADQSETGRLSGAFQSLFTNGSEEAGPQTGQNNLQKEFAVLASTALNTNSRSETVVLSVGGEIYVAVALPVIGPAERAGAIMISTQRGEIDSIIRSAREQILQMFLLVAISSIVLSMVLANSIVRPLRRLSEAAQTAHDEAGEKINLARINIPDLSARPDEIGDLSRSMRNMTDALLTRVDDNRRFAADVAHEIKNPLTSMNSAVETLGYVKDEDSRLELLEVIKSDVNRLDRLVTDISNASRLEAELVQEAWQDVNICGQLESLLQNYKQRDSIKDISLTLNTEVQDCVVRGLEGRLAQVFTNLISNAISFVGPTGTIEVNVRRGANDSLIVEVKDDGPGIPDRNLDDIFNRFYSERPVEQFGEHSGLGLAISKQIVDAHGGRISARNHTGGGALFSVKLPQ